MVLEEFVYDDGGKIVGLWQKDNTVTVVESKLDYGEKLTRWWWWKDSRTVVSSGAVVERELDCDERTRRWWC